MCVFATAWAEGVSSTRRETFDVVQLGDNEPRLLLLGADETNLVVLTPNVNKAGHPGPKYISRPLVNGFRIVGTASINDFICSAAK